MFQFRFLLSFSAFLAYNLLISNKSYNFAVELPLNEEEKAKFAASAAAVRKTNAALHEVGAL